MRTQKPSSRVALLIVEDDHGHAKIIERVACEHAEVAVAGSIEEAMGLLTAHAYHVLVLDQQLPDGLGSELQQWVTDQGMEPAVIFVSADERWEQSVIEAGAIGFVRKSGNYANSLTDLISQVCRRST